MYKFSTKNKRSYYKVIKLKSKTSLGNKLNKKFSPYQKNTLLGVFYLEMLINLKFLKKNRIKTTTFWYLMLALSHFYE